MMYKTETGGYSESIASVVEDVVILNWNQKIVGQLLHKIHDNSMLVGHHKASLSVRIKKWFRNQQRINDNIVRRDIREEAKGSLVETMRGLE